MSADLYGQGLRYPPSATSGEVELSAGDVRILESIEQILSTPRGTCPMDPNYGVDLDAYDLASQPEQIGWRVADAIDRSEPRIRDLEVAIIDSDLENGILFIDVRITPIGSNNAINRVFPLYMLA